MTVYRDVAPCSPTRFACFACSDSKLRKLICSAYPSTPTEPSAQRRYTSTCRISFGKGENFWSNVFPTELVAQFKGDIARFGSALKTIKKLEPIFAMIPVHVMLKMFRFSAGFGERMVYPLVALFFGTGNQTPYVSSAILVRADQTPME